MRLMIGWVKMLPQPGIWSAVPISATRSSLVFCQSMSLSAKGFSRGGPKALEFLRGRLPSRELPLASQPVQLLDRRPGRGPDGPVEKLPVQVAGSLSEPFLMGGDQMIGDPGEQVGRPGPEDIAHGLAGLLERGGGGVQQVGPITEYSQLDQPGDGIVNQGRDIVEERLQREVVAMR